MVSKTNITVETAKKLRSKLGGKLSTQLNESQLFVDLADIHEISRAYIDIVERLLSTNDSDKEAIEDILYEIDIQIFEHLPYHLKSLKKLLPQMIEELDSAKR